MKLEIYFNDPARVATHVATLQLEGETGEVVVAVCEDKNHVSKRKERFIVRVVDGNETLAPL